MTGLQEHFPDLNRAAIGDLQTRNVYFRSYLHLDVAYAAPFSTTLTTDEPQRIRSVYVAPDVSSIVTIQIQVDGRDVFDDSSRPRSNIGATYPTSVYNFPANAEITAIIENDTGVPADSIHVNIEVEPYTLVPRTPQVEPHGPARKRPSTRAEIAQFNATGSLVPAVVTHRVVGTPSPRVLPIGEPLGYRPREVIP